MAAFFSRSYFCEDCNTSHNDWNTHRCKTKCSMCYHSPPCKTVKIIKCDQCNCVFKSQHCFDNHARKYKNKSDNHEPSSNKKGRKRIATKCKDEQAAKKLKSNIASESKQGNDDETSICDRFKRCDVCYKHMTTEKIPKHKCGFTKCKMCKKDVNPNGNIYV